MVTEPIPEDIKNFVFQYVDNIADVEALLLLRRECDKRWQTAHVAKRLYISEKDAADVLARLHSRGFLDTAGNTYWYSCTPTTLSTTVDRVADFYTTHLIPVTNLIHSKAANRIQEFADAFKLRKDD